MNAYKLFERLFMTKTSIDKEKKLIDKRVKEMNHQGKYCCSEVSTIIKQLNDFINEKNYLSEERIESLLGHLVGFYTITPDIPCDKGMKILRAVKFNKLNETPCFSEVSRLSYIPETSRITPKIGRLNKHGKAMFYGCIHFDDSLGKNVAFSEVSALKYETINILMSVTTSEINVRYIGIYDHIKRESKPYFLSKDTYSYFKEVYKYMETEFDKHLFVAFQLCDAFFSDVMRKKESAKLYFITSTLASIFLDESKIDGLIYSSVETEGSPVIAIKPSSVNTKISHKTAVSCQIQESYGYAIYSAKELYSGVVNGDKIDWEKL